MIAAIVRTAAVTLRTQAHIPGRYSCAKPREMPESASVQAAAPPVDSASRHAAVAIQKECAGKAGPFSFHRLQRGYLPLFTDLVTDDAANSRAADRSDSAAAREHGTADGTDTGTDRGALVPIRHPGTTAQAEQHCDGQCTD